MIGPSPTESNEASCKTDAVRSPAATVGHTPIPWVVSSGILVCSQDAVVVAHCAFGSGTRLAAPLDVCQANADLIVKAVNSHEALVRALKQTEAMFDGDRVRFLTEDRAEAIDVLTDIRAALKLAGVQ